MTLLSAQEILSTDSQIQAWHSARFGLMIHWGLYSIPGGEWKGRKTDYVAEWIMSRFRIPIAEYEKLALDFKPDRFDADAWCRLAKNAGMGYLIFTAKHHDGFAMFQSDCDPYNIVDATPFGRDPIAELADACSRHGLKFGLYYSQSLDWHEENAGGTEPNTGTNHEGMPWGNNWDFPDHHKKDFSRYFEHKVKPQIRELLSNYGSIGYLWFDCPFTISHSQSIELYQLAKSLQPDILINSRLGNGLGDFQSLGDNLIPGMPFDRGWEAVGTLNNSWGYKRDDSEWKTAKEVVELLGGLAGKGINYLLNVGPDQTGKIPEPSIRVLEDVGRWMEQHRNSIHDVERSPYPADVPSGPVTRNGETLYYHLHDQQNSNRLDLGGLTNTIQCAWLLNAPDVLLKVENCSERRVIELPDETFSALLPVVAVQVKGEPHVTSGILPRADGGLFLPVSLATIHLEESENSRNSTTLAAFRFEPDGSRVSREGGIRISSLGSTSNWWKTGDWISWKFRHTTPGIFRIQIVSTGLYHGQPWQGGHRVSIHVDEQELSTTLNASKVLENVATRYYAQVISECGIVSLLKRGVTQLSLRAEEIQPGVAGLAIVSVRLIPEKTDL